MPSSLWSRWWWALSLEHWLSRREGSDYDKQLNICLYICISYVYASFFTSLVVTLEQVCFEDLKYKFIITQLFFLQILFSLCLFTFLRKQGHGRGWVSQLSFLKSLENGNSPAGLREYIASFLIACLAWLTPWFFSTASPQIMRLSLIETDTGLFPT